MTTESLTLSSILCHLVSMGNVLPWSLWVSIIFRCAWEELRATFKAWSVDLFSGRSTQPWMYSSVLETLSVWSVQGSWLPDFQDFKNLLLCRMEPVTAGLSALWELENMQNALPRSWSPGEHQILHYGTYTTLFQYLFLLMTSNRNELLTFV